MIADSVMQVIAELRVQPMLKPVVRAPALVPVVSVAEIVTFARLPERPPIRALEGPGASIGGPVKALALAVAVVVACRLGFADFIAVVLERRQGGAVAPEQFVRPAPDGSLKVRAQTGGITE